LFWVMMENGGQTPLPKDLQKKWDKLKHSRNGIVNPNRVSYWDKQLGQKYGYTVDIDMSEPGTPRRKRCMYQLYPPPRWMDADWDGLVVTG